jgi:hypothetical protein
MAQAVGFASGFGNTNSSSVVVTAPANTVNGDILVFGTVVASSVGFNTLAGWTLLHDYSIGAGTYYRVFYKQALSEPASYTWTISSGGGPCAGIMIAVQGARLPIDVESLAQNGTASLSVDGIPIDPVAANQVMLWIAARPAVAVGANINPPSGYPNGARQRNNTGSAGTTAQIALCADVYTSAVVTPQPWYHGTSGSSQNFRSGVSMITFPDAYPDAQPLLFCEA